MGQAKRRGSFEERKAQALAARAKFLAENSARATYPRRRAGARTALIAGMAVAAMLSGHIPPRQK